MSYKPIIIIFSLFTNLLFCNSDALTASQSSIMPFQLIPNTNPIIHTGILWHSTDIQPISGGCINSGYCCNHLQLKIKHKWILSHTLFNQLKKKYSYLNRFKPVLVIEIEERHHKGDTIKIFNYLSGSGYIAFALDVHVLEDINNM